MRKPLATKIFGLTVLYCFVFCVIVILQFSNQGTFSHPVGGMTIRGKVIESEPRDDDSQSITGGIKIFYGGLEFSLQDQRGKGLTILDTAGANTVINPEFMIMSENIARFILPGGTVLTFNSLDSSRGTELQISAEFADNIAEVIIPIIPRRSSLIQDSGQLGIMFSGSRYVFSSLGHELETGNIVFSRDNSFVAYRSRGRQRAFDPADYVIAQEPNYYNLIRSWQDSSFAGWNQNPASIQTEDDVIAYLSQSVQRGNFVTAIMNIPVNFNESSRHSYRAAAFTGGMVNAYETFIAAENEKTNLITRLTRARSLELFKEEHVLDYLLTRSNMVLANEVIELAMHAKPEMLTSDFCVGLFELFFDIRRWRPEAINPIEHLTEQMLVLIPEILNRDTENDAVYASSPEGNRSDYSLRLGKAILYWAESTRNDEWSKIGRSLILSAISTGSAGRLHNILSPTDYYPRASWLTDSGHWAWTVSPSIRLQNVGGNLNLNVTYPVNTFHHLIVRGVRPFLGVVIHGMTWRSDNQFERYESSGWIYYPEEQTLVIKLRQRSSMETVRIIYQAALPQPVLSENAEDSVE